MAAVTHRHPAPDQPEVPQRAAAAARPRLGDPDRWLWLIAIGYALVNIATQKPNKNTVHIEGIGEAQQLFGGVPQEGARLGSEDAPVTVQVFGDEQSSTLPRRLPRRRSRN